MLEKLLLNAEKENLLFRVFLISLVITLVFGFFNSFIGGNSLFLVAFVSLAFSYPITRYIKGMDKEELENQMKAKNLLFRHEKELTVFWALFVGLVLGLYVSIPIGGDFSYQEAFLQKVSGNITDESGVFMKIFFNNLEVNFLTFMLSFLVFSGLIFVLVWNASIVAYYLYSLGSHEIALFNGLMLMSHGLLEVGAYVLAGIAGSILAFRIERSRSFNHELNKEFVKDFVLLISTSFLLLVFGAVVEVL